MSPYRDDEDYWHETAAPRGPMRYLGYAFLVALGLWVFLVFVSMFLVAL